MSEDEGAELWVNPGANGERLGPQDAPSYLILRLSAALARRYNRDYAQALGVTSPEVRLIALVNSEGPLTFGKIVEKSMMDKAQASRPLAGLIENNLIVLTGPNGAASRFTSRTSAKLTDKGKKIFDRALKIAQHHQLDILKSLTKDERRSLYAMLHRLLKEAQRLDRADDQGR